MKPIFKEDVETALALTPLNPSLPAPLYHQLHRAIRAKIISGMVPTGSKLPSEKYFIEKLGISRITVKRALDELAKSGLVSRKRGRGTIVMTNTDLNFSTGMNDYVKNVAKLRENTNAKILSRKTVRPPENVRQRLDLKASDKAEKIEHTLTRNGEAISFVTTFLPLELTNSLTTEDLEREPLLTLLNQNGIGIVRAEQRIFASAATQKEADVFDVSVGAPLLKIRCLMIDSFDRAVEFIDAVYHPDRYQYRMTLTTIDPSQR